MAEQIVNGGFELSVLTGKGWVTGNNADSTGAWTFSGLSGIYATGTPFDGGPPVPAVGSQAAYLFGSNGGRGAQHGRDVPDDPGPVLTQGVNVASAGAYTLTFQSAQQNVAAIRQMMLMCRLREATNKYRLDFVVTPGVTFAATSFVLPALVAAPHMLSFAVLPPPYFGVRGATIYSGSYVSGGVYLDAVSLA